MIPHCREEIRVLKTGSLYINTVFIFQEIGYSKDSKLIVVEATAATLYTERHTKQHFSSFTLSIFNDRQSLACEDLFQYNKIIPYQQAGLGKQVHESVQARKSKKIYQFAFRACIFP